MRRSWWGEVQSWPKVCLPDLEWFTCRLMSSQLPLPLPGWLWLSVRGYIIKAEKVTSQSAMSYSIRADQSSDPGGLLGQLLGPPLEDKAESGQHRAESGRHKAECSQHEGDGDGLVHQFGISLVTQNASANNNVGSEHEEPSQVCHTLIPSFVENDYDIIALIQEVALQTRNNYGLEHVRSDQLTDTSSYVWVSFRVASAYSRL